MIIMKDDAISRQSAIDALIKADYEFTGILSEPRARMFEKTINALPPVQPEIIRCKDCKHLQKWRSEESAKKFGQIYECARGVLNCPTPEDFCSRA